VLLAIPRYWTSGGQAEIDFKIISKGGNYLSNPVYNQVVNEHVYMVGLPCLGIKPLLSSFVLAGEKIALFEAGTTSTAPLLLEGLSRLGVKREDIDYLIVSHIHMDHAGGSGYLAGEFPNAKVMVHERGAKHLIDPSKLIASTRKVFGDKDVIVEHYGEIIPIPEERVVPLKDGDVIDLGGSRRLRVIHTPGHAPHHLCLYDPLTKGIFSGEALGIWVEDLNIFSPSTPMPDFNLDQSISSILRLLEYDTEIIYFSHFGYTRAVQDTIYKIIGQLNCWGQIIKESPPDEAGARLTRYVLEKEWAQWNSARLAEEKGRKDMLDWLTWRIGAVLAPGFQNFYRLKKTKRDLK
jgi:glyoxylase-like metal-dependent hydrolase (beta-lactamase superfamily II)